MRPRGRRQLAHLWESPPTHRSVGRLERLAYQRHARDLETGHERGLWFDDQAAARACEFIERFCRHSKGEWAGQLLVLEGWQRFIVSCLFGWRRADGSRRFRLCYVQVARKNGKSTLLAAIALYLTIADGEAGAEVYSVATKRDQAKLVFDEAARMVRKDPDLLEHVEVFGGKPHSRTDNVSCLALGSKLEPLASDNDTLDGLNVHGAICDELHAWKDAGLWDVIETATGARRQPLILAITTPGAGCAGICWEQREYLGGVLDPAVPVDDDAYFAYIAEPDDGLDWADLETWERGNPNIGVSVKVDQLREKAERAKHSPARQNQFRRLHCGSWTEQVSRWIDLGLWKRCGGEFSPRILEGRTCYGGLDLASTADLTAFVLVFPPQPGDDERPWWYVLTSAWVPEGSLDRRKRTEAETFAPWIRSGDLETTPGDATDYQAVRERILECRDRYQIQAIGFDPWNATQLVSELMETDGLPLVKVSQGVGGMSGPSKEFEMLVARGELRHGDHPVLTWCASNVATWEDTNGNIKPSRKSSGGRIDAIVAAIMAVGLAAVDVGRGVSVYETRGIDTA